jgi:RNA polymerase sigma factor (sigma-70 family)
MTTHPIRRPLARMQATELGQADGPTHGQLLVRFIEERDEAALAALVLRLGPMVLGVCRRVIGDAHLAEDAFQATFLVLVRKAAEIRQREQVGGWLYGVAYRISRRARATRVRRLAKEQSMSGRTAPSTEPVDRLDDLLPVLDEELAQLPDHYRAVIVLCDMEGRTRREAARRLDIPDGTLSNRLTAARRMLARRLTQRGVTLGITSLLSASVTARVSAALADSTVRFATGVTSNGVVTVALAEGELKMMLLTKLKGLATAGLIAVIGLGFAAGTLPANGMGDSPPIRPAINYKLSFITANRSDKIAEPPAPKVIDYDGPVDTVAFSPDGKLIAVQARIDGGEGDNTPLRYKEHTVKLWDINTGKVVNTFVQEGRSSGIAFAPDGKSIAAIVTKIDGKGTDNEIHIWSVTEKLETNLRGSKAVWLYEVAYSPDGKTIAASGVLCDEAGLPNGGEVTVWELATGNVLWQNQDHKNAVRRLAFSPDGKQLVTPSDDSTLRIWDAATGKHLRTLETSDDRWFSAAYSPDGKFIAAGGSNGAKVWDAETGDLKHSFNGFEMGRILMVQFLADGTLVTGGTSEKRDGNLKLWDVKTGKLVREIAEPNKTLMGLDISRDGKMAAVGTWEKTLVIVPIGK